MKEKIVEFLLNNADPSIILRVKKEILNTLSNKEESELLSKIIPQKNIQTVINSQKPDGWFGNTFHGASASAGAGMLDNMEVGLRFLAEKGIPAENGYISRAVNSFLLDEPHCKEHRLKAPENDYDYTASGLYIARSSVIIRAGYEYLLPKNDFIDLKHDIDFSFKTFMNVLNYPNLDDVVDTSKRQLCFKHGILWPCSYHLRMLAHSQGWRNNKNIPLLTDSMNHLFSFTHSKEKMIYTYIKGQFKGPCLAFIHSQMCIMDEFYADFDSMELFARCGVIKQVPFLRNKYDYLISLVDDNLNMNCKINPSERKWSPYYGFALEEDWKTKIRKNCDILFRMLLIIHYAERSN